MYRRGYVTLAIMQLAEVFTALGLERLENVLRGISIGKLRTFQMFDRLKTRAHLGKLNSQTLRNAAPKLLDRLAGGDEDLAKDLGQAILLSHFDLIIAVLNHLKIPHQGGFFENDTEAGKDLPPQWRQDAYEAFRDRFEPSLLAFYLNFLAWELKIENTPFVPDAAVEAEAT